MALFNVREELYEYELSTFGVTYCDDRNGPDLLIIAPGLVNHPLDVEAVEAHESSVQLLDHLYVGEKLVGFAYAPIGPMLNYFLNGFVPDTFPISYLTQLFKLAIYDQQCYRGISDEECERVAKAYEDAETVMSGMPDLPGFILKRIKGFVAENYDPHPIH